ncbi:MAG: 1-deoxy-D-xylulose-5-phosphate reductoisomerase [Candidatus Methanosuratincola sp.]
MRNVSILGSTGSIGRQTLEVISSFPEDFKVTGLSAGSNIPLLKEQIARFKPAVVSVLHPEDARVLSNMRWGFKVEILSGSDGARAVSTHEDTQLVVSAMVGAAGLSPTYEAIRSGKDVALANKEVLVMAGGLITNEAKRRGVTIIPVDSEHNAIFQTLGHGSTEFVKRIILTASGGPFRKTPKSEMGNVTVESALKHPTWKMGDKITIDSATLMNKGLEMIEASWLFGFPPENIAVWIHPQSIVHSLVEFVDGGFIVQMSLPDMKIPISYALGYPRRLPLAHTPISPMKFSNLTFEEPDLDKFPSITLAYRAAKEGGTMPAVLNAANEVAVKAFLDGRIRFNDICRIIETVLDRHIARPAEALDEILEIDSWARQAARYVIEQEIN